MNLKRFNSLLRLLVLLVIAHVSPANAQDAPPKTAAEIRALVMKSRSKDLKISDEANQALSALDVKSLPALVAILNKGKPCEQVVVAQLIVELDPKDPNIVPVMTKVTRGGSAGSNEDEMMCRRAAAYVLVFSAEGIRVLTHLLKQGNLFERRSAIFAFDDLTETSNYPEGILTAMKEAIAEIAKATKDKDQVLSEMADEVLAQIARGPNLELGALAKKYIAESP